MERSDEMYLWQILVHNKISIWSNSEQNYIHNLNFEHLVYKPDGTLFEMAYLVIMNMPHNVPIYGS